MHKNGKKYLAFVYSVDFLLSDIHGISLIVAPLSNMAYLVRNFLLFSLVVQHQAFEKDL
jgi:hypothetical protein